MRLIATLLITSLCALSGFLGDSTVQTIEKRSGRGRIPTNIGGAANTGGTGGSRWFNFGSIFRRRPRPPRQDNTGEEQSTASESESSAGQDSVNGTVIQNPENITNFDEGDIGTSSQEPETDYIMQRLHEIEVQIQGLYPSDGYSGIIFESLVDVGEQIREVGQDMIADNESPEFLRRQAYFKKLAAEFSTLRREYPVIHGPRTVLPVIYE